MAFKIDDFIDKLASTLAVQGFINTAREIRETIAAGYIFPRTLPNEPPYEMSSKQQYVLCADLIEQNIVIPYAAWEAATLQLAQVEPDADGNVEFQKEWEQLFLVTDGWQTSPLGSFDYRNSIAKIAELAKKLRGMEPPPPVKPAPRSGPDDTGHSGALVADGPKHSQYRRAVRKAAKFDVSVALERLRNNEPVRGWGEVLVEPDIRLPQALQPKPKRFLDQPFAVAQRVAERDLWGR